MSKKLVALSASAISVVYIAGYVLTEPAARQIAAAEAGGAVTARPAATATSAPQVQRPQERDPRRPENQPQPPGRPGQPGGTQVGPPAGQDPRRPGAPNNVQPPAPSPQAPAARPPAQIIPTPTTLPIPSAPVSYRDGVFTGHGTSRRGDVDVAITIQGGKITSADITHSTLQYPISRISRLPGQVVDRQGAQIDNVTGSTLSARAFLDAVRMALAQAA